MARKRMIEPNIWDSSTMHQAKCDGERLLFIGLITQADDEGRLKAYPASIMGRIMSWAMGRYTQKDVTEWLRHLEETGSIINYQVNGVPYIQIRKWNKYQNIARPKPSYYPPPPKEVAFYNDLKQEWIPCNEQSVKDQCGINERSMSDQCSVTDQSLINQGQKEKEKEKEYEKEKEEEERGGLVRSNPPPPLNARKLIMDNHLYLKGIPEIYHPYMKGEIKGVIPCKKGSDPNAPLEFPMTCALFEKLKQDYHTTEEKLLKQFIAIKQWCISNPSKRKTYKGMMRFIVAWLNRQNDRGNL